MILKGVYSITLSNTGDGSGYASLNGPSVSAHLYSDGSGAFSEVDVLDGTTSSGTLTQATGITGTYSIRVSDGFTFTLGSGGATSAIIQGETGSASGMSSAIVSANVELVLESSLP